MSVSPVSQANQQTLCKMFRGCVRRIRNKKTDSERRRWLWGAAALLTPLSESPPEASEASGAPQPTSTSRRRFFNAAPGALLNIHSRLLF